MVNILVFFYLKTIDIVVILYARTFIKPYRVEMIRLSLVEHTMSLNKSNDFAPNIFQDQVSRLCVK